MTSARRAPQDSAAAAALGAVLAEGRNGSAKPAAGAALKPDSDPQAAAPRSAAAYSTAAPASAEKERTPGEHRGVGGSPVPDSSAAAAAGTTSDPAQADGTKPKRKRAAKKVKAAVKTADGAEEGTGPGSQEEGAPPKPAKKPRAKKVEWPPGGPPPPAPPPCLPWRPAVPVQWSCGRTVRETPASQPAETGGEAAFALPARGTRAVRLSVRRNGPGRAAVRAGNHEAAEVRGGGAARHQLECGGPQGAHQQGALPPALQLVPPSPPPGASPHYAVTKAPVCAIHGVPTWRFRTAPAECRLPEHGALHRRRCTCMGPGVSHNHTSEGTSTQLKSRSVSVT